MVHHTAGIPADEVVAHLQGPGRAGLGVVLEHLAPARYACIRGDLHEYPAVLQYEGLDLRHPNRVVGPDLGRVGRFRSKHGIQCAQGAYPNKPLDEGAAIDFFFVRHTGKFPIFVPDMRR